MVVAYYVPVGVARSVVQMLPEVTPTLRPKPTCPAAFTTLLQIFALFKVGTPRNFLLQIATSAVPPRPSSVPRCSWREIERKPRSFNFVVITEEHAQIKALHVITTV